MTHHSPVFESSGRVGRNRNCSSEKVETLFAVDQCSVKTFGATNAVLVVEQ